MFRPGWVGCLLVLAACDRVLGLDPIQPLPDAQTRAPGTWAQIAEGGGHSCGIREDGSLWCWGDGSSGQLGLGMDQAAAQDPARVGSTTWKQVSAGLKTTCAIDTSDELWCWGLNSSGQLGDGTATNQYAPEQVTGGPWLAAAVGDSHVCALDAGGAAWCWGDNTYGELGQNDQVPRATPTKVPSPISWTAITAATQLSCALATDHTTWCWGYNGNGQIGDGQYNSLFVPAQVDSESWTTISAGGNHVCALLADGRLRCWGSNLSGELGIEQVGNSATPAAVGDDSLRFTGVAAGAAHTCAPSTDGQLWCWGSNASGQLGGGASTPDNPDPHVVSGGAASWVGVAAGLAQTCGLGADHNLWCFGHGTGSGSNVATPTQVPGSWSQISVGGNTTCGLATDASLWCWGYNLYGEVGDGSYTTRTVPTKIADPAWLAVSANSESACALRADGTVFCWGQGAIGGDAEMRLIPTPVAGGPYSTITVGDQYACALTAAAQQLVCWGINYEGQLGTGDTMNHPTPFAIGSSQWSAISAGNNHMCGVTGGDLECWGDNTFGELGDNTTVPSFVPVPVGTASQVTAGNYDSCAIAAGALACWGWNAYGEDGIDSASMTVTPTVVSGPSTWSEVSVQNAHACAIAQDGTLWCWGYNGDGQVAQSPQNLFYYVPTQVGTAATWLHTSVGGNSSCAVQTDSTLWCWGDNTYGQLGLGATSHSGPVLVP